MSSLPKPDAAQLLATDLIKFYDEFVAFQGSCAFLCDAFVALTAGECVLDKASVHGLHMYAGEVKQKAQGLKEQLKVLREKPLTD